MRRKQGTLLPIVLSPGQHTAWTVLGQLNRGPRRQGLSQIHDGRSGRHHPPAPSARGSGGFLGIAGLQSPLMLLTGGMLLIAAVAAGCARRRSA